jgi:type III secretion protein V
MTLQLLATSLEIPLAPQLPGIGLPDALAHDVWAYAPRLVTAEVATTVWRDWYPERADAIEHEECLTAFTAVLGEAARLGFRLGRLRPAFADVQADAPPATWWAVLEDALARSATSLRLYLSASQYRELIAAEWPADRTSWKEQVRLMHDELLTELGVQSPPLSVQIDDALVEPWFRCEWNDLRLPDQAGLTAAEMLVNDTPDRLRLLNFDSRAAVNPGSRQASAVVALEERSLLEEAGLTTWTVRGYWILSIAAMMRASAAAFLTGPIVELHLLLLEQAYPELVSAVRARFQLPVLTAILRQLVDEQIPIRELRSILHALVMVESTVTANRSKSVCMPLPGTGTFVTARPSQVGDLATADFVDVARRALKRNIAGQFANRTNTLVAYLLDPAIERRLSASARFTEADRERLLEGVTSEMRYRRPSAPKPVLLVSSEVRSRVRQELIPEYRSLVVLSYDEIPPEMNVQPVSRISATFASDEPPAEQPASKS